MKPILLILLLATSAGAQTTEPEPTLTGTFAKFDPPQTITVPLNAGGSVVIRTALFTVDPNAPKFGPSELEIEARALIARLKAAVEKAEKSAAQRKYSLKEIDALRRAHEQRWLYGTTYTPPPTKEEIAAHEEALKKGIWSGGGGTGTMVMSRSYKEAEKIEAVAALVRADMELGITADDVYAEDKRLYDERNRPAKSP